ncbi:MAG: hypothetical protein HFI34_07660 [Lachnospiraceae bacterium]|nr:hypothetical protein [Lachnospiraceae bacterium]
MKIIQWLIAILFSILWCILALIYMHIRGKEKNFEELKKFKEIFKLEHLIFILAGTALGLFLFWKTGDKGKDVVSCYKNMLTFFWLLPIGFIDYKEKIIPNKIILGGIAYWIIYFFAECFINDISIKSIAKYSLAGFVFGAGVLLISALIIRGGVGMGDVKLFAVIGMLYGFNGVFTILFMTLLLLFLVCIFLLVLKKVDRKSTFPMAPFVTIGFAISVVMGI